MSFVLGKILPTPDLVAREDSRKQNSQKHTKAPALAYELPPR
jgi:hypothetical protein